MSALGEQAVRFAERGWYVFPVKPRGKEPLTRNGFKNATADPARVAGFWRTHPHANIGLHPGPSGLLVVDIDGRAGEAEAEQLGLPESPTLTVRTGRREGGRHLYFELPVGNFSEKKLGKHIEVRGYNGYVIVPNSIHPSGATYEWVDGPGAPRPLTETERALFHGAAAKRPGGVRQVGSAAGVINEGERHISLTSHAGRLFRRGLSDEDVLVEVQEINRALEHHADPRHLHPRGARDAGAGVLPVGNVVGSSLVFSKGLSPP